MSDRANSDDAAPDGVFEQGRRVRGEVLGEKHVERSLAQCERLLAADAGARHRVRLGQDLVATRAFRGATAA